ncbi:MAG: PhoH family protein [Planctomycetaceae bacterium]
MFGPRDEYIRLIREAIGINVVLRGDRLQLIGETEPVECGRKVIRDLCQIIENTKSLPQTDVLRVLEKHQRERRLQSQSAVMTIDLKEKSRPIQPRSAGQQEYLQAIDGNDLVLCVGPAGCGKTYLAVAMAIRALRLEQVRKIVLVRPAVEAGEKLGYLPGDMLAKVNPFLRPLLDALNDMLSYDQVKRYMSSDVIEILPLAFMRGRTLNETFMILDEGQNTTATQMKMFLTRMGTQSKIVVTGDVTQIDLPSDVTSGLTDAIQRLAEIDGVGIARLSSRDIVRHKLVTEIVDAYDRSEMSS